MTMQIYGWQEASPSTPRPRQKKPRVHRLGSGLISPRLALLAALLYNPPILAGYLLYQYGPNVSCVAGPLCAFDSFPAPLQVVAILAGSLLLWLLLYLLVARRLELPRRQQSGFQRALSDLSAFRTVRPLFAGYAAVLALALVVALANHRLTLPIFVLAAVSVAVCLYGALGAQEAPLEAAISLPMGQPFLPTSPHTSPVGRTFLPASLPIPASAPVSTAYPAATSIPGLRLPAVPPLPAGAVAAWDTPDDEPDSAPDADDAPTIVPPARQEDDLG
jgi:hypothetical protein